jgi:hypothetical protein
MSNATFRKIVSIAAAVLFAAAASGGGEPKLPYKLTYEIQTGVAEANQLAIDPSGVVTASIAHSVPGSPIRMLGRFSVAMGPSDPDLVAIGTLIESYGLAVVRPYTSPQRDGALYALFTIEKDGKETKHVADTAAMLPDPLEDLAVALTNLTSRVAQKAPQRAVSIRAELDPTSAAPGGRVRVTLDIRNAGPSPAELRNLAGFRQGGADELKLDLWTPPASAGGVPILVTTVGLAGSEWHLAEGKALRTKDPYLKLEGQGSIRVWTEIRVPEAAPGALLAGLVYHAHAVSEAERRNNDLVVGLYRADPVNLTIVPAPAR